MVECERCASKPVPVRVSGIGEGADVDQECGEGYRGETGEEGVFVVGWRVVGRTAAGGSTAAAEH